MNHKKNVNDDSQRLFRGVEYGPIHGVEYGPIHGVEYGLVHGINYESTREDDEYVKKEMQEQVVLKDSLKMLTKVTVDSTSERWECTSNFRLKLLKRIIKVSDTEKGEESHYFYRMALRVLSRNGTSQIFDAIVPSEHVKGTAWITKATHSLAKLPNDKAEKEDFLEAVQACIESETAETEMIYPCCGWRNVPGLGMQFVYSGGIIGKPCSYIRAEGDEYTLEIDSQTRGTKQNFDMAMKAAEICRKKRRV